MSINMDCLEILYTYNCCIAATAEKSLGDPVDPKPMAPLDVASVLAAAQARAKKAAVVAALGKGQVQAHLSATKQW